MKTWYAFASGRADGNREMRDVLGGKGANLAEMCNLGVPVPPGFTLPTGLCSAFYADGEQLSGDVLGALREGIAHIESHLDGPRFGDARKPLLLSVRSGARDSMPGMMDTVLNIGLTVDTLEGLAMWSGNRRFALDSFRRLIQMYGDVVCGLDRHALDEPLEAYKKSKGYVFDSELGASDLEQIVDQLLGVFQALSGEPFPRDPVVQLRHAVAAVFKSWHSKRAHTYRALHNIPVAWGTAATVQAMVFGNLGMTSATGVAFSRNPSTGDGEPLGEWLPNAQGEDVVAGIRTPELLASLESALPEAYGQFHTVMRELELHYRDLQDIEFTIQEGRLFVLQTRNGKRTAQAALKVAVDMVREGLIDRRTAVMRVTPEQLSQLMHPQIDPKAPKACIAKGLPASPGAASGRLVFDSEEAVRRAALGEAVILVRKETSPEDIHGMVAARGILTQTGGMTSHAAVVARGMGRVCVSGCQALSVDSAAGVVHVNVPAKGDEPGRELTLKAGDELTLDGSLGEVYLGIVPTVEVDMSGDFATFMSWADGVRALGIRANADTPTDAAKALENGAQGIGLCRTEHMFFAPERILAVRQMILASTPQERARALAKLEPMQQYDFEQIFRAMVSKPVTIRLLDPPLHEFLPHSEEELEIIARDLGVDASVIRRKRDALIEVNPMLGHRGCRLGISFPEIYRMQARAILNAACAMTKLGVHCIPEIMIPLVIDAEELKRLRALVDEEAAVVFAAQQREVPYRVGTMIELPRAALLADDIAQHADFFSFGTNDLTQSTMGFSRDDVGRFLPDYLEQGVLASDPFQTVDQRGVGRLVEMGITLGRKAKPELKVGVCGEQGGDPASIAFFAAIGADYVSCSPYRVPIARLAAAQAEVRRSRV